MERVLRELARFDTSGESALPIIAAFQHIAERAVWDEADILTAMSQYSGYPARIALGGGVYLRAEVDGRLSHDATPPHERWPAERTSGSDADSIWLERIGPVTLTEAVILHSSAELLRKLRERAAAGHSTEFNDPLAAIVATADLALTERLLQRLGIDPAVECVAIAQPGPTVGLQMTVGDSVAANWSDSLGPSDRFGVVRTGIGIRVQAIRFAESWKTALTALSLASEGSDFDPGATVMRYEDVALLARLTEAKGLADSPDVVGITRLCIEVPWAARTLDGIARQTSLRLVASMLFTHHSTVQSRLAIMEDRLGWEVTTADGKLRLQLALAARRFLLHGLEVGPPRSTFAPVPSAKWRP
ncbi:helix-turn-helix domain-containing protein [Arthrobacter sp. Z1-9]